MTAIPSPLEPEAGDEVTRHVGGQATGLRPWYCAVKWCDEPVVVFTLADVDLDAVQAQAMVPFCHEHGPRAGGGV